MAAPAVESDRAIVCTEVNVPAAGLKVGAAAVGVRGGVFVLPPPLQPATRIHARKLTRIELRIVPGLPRAPFFLKEPRTAEHREIIRGETDSLVHGNLPGLSVWY